MSIPITHRFVSAAVPFLVMSAVIGLAAGCAGSPSVSRSYPTTAAAPPKPGAVDPVPVVRYGRYTLVEVRPETAQQDLLQQIVDISLPRTDGTTIGDALHIVLQRTGYRLCEADTTSRVLYALPLPAVHLALGPLTLRDALITLAGPAWTLAVDPVARTVCFERKGELNPPAEPDTTGSTAPAAAQSPHTPSNADRDGSAQRKGR